MKIKMQRVSKRALHEWKQGEAYGDVKEYARLRAEIKGKAKLDSRKYDKTFK